MHRERGSAFAPDSCGSGLAFALDTRGPGLAAPGRGGGRWLAFSHGIRAPSAAAPSSAAAALASCPGSPAASGGGSRLDLRVLLVPAAHARLALRIAALPPRAVSAELRQRLLLPALCAAFHPEGVLVLALRLFEGLPRVAEHHGQAIRHAPPSEENSASSGRIPGYG
jgi:hypothetical protein